MKRFILSVCLYALSYYGLLADSPILLFLTTSTFYLAFSLQFLELEWLVKRIGSLVSCDIAARRRVLLPSGCLSQAGQRAEVQLEHLERTLRSARHGAPLRTASSSAQEIFPELELPGDHYKYDVDFVYARIADFMSVKFEGDAAAVALQKPELDEMGRVYLSRTWRSRGLEATLAAYLSTTHITTRKDSITALPGEPRTHFSERMLSITPADVPSTELFLQGFSHMRLCSFSDGCGSTGDLVLLYRRAPVIADPCQFELFARSLTRELPKLRRICEDSSRLFEQLLAKDGKGQVLTHMSHDMKSPLNNIRSVLNLLRVEAGEGENAEIIDVGLNNCEAAAELVESVLDFSSYAAGKLRVTPECFDLNALVSDVAQNYKVAAKLKGLDLVVDPLEPHAWTRADRRQIKRVVSNFISNAVKYTRHGSIRVSVSSYRDQTASVSVTDSGIGMRKAQLEKLFKPFTRLHETEGDGVGLGLALSKILAELNGGTISVTSEIGVGSTFAISLPATEPSKTRNRTRRSSGGLEGVDRARKKCPIEKMVRVLLTDDDPDCVESLARNIQDDSIRVLKAVTVSQAISILNFEKLDALITDDNMPEGGGLELVKALRKRSASTPVALLSGGNMSTAGHYERYGITKIFKKPVDITDLRAWIDSLKLPERDRHQAQA